MFDPITIWMQGTVFWVKVFRHQHEAYLRLLGAVAQKIPHENSAQIAREAEAVKAKLASTRKPAPRRAPDAKKDLAPA